jgi:hypothetical protein
MLERIEPSVDRLITHVEERSDYVAPAGAKHDSSTHSDHSDDKGGE